MELGEADDVVFGTDNSKQKMGAVGLLTKGLTNRAQYYEEAVQKALIPYMNPSLY
jgi:non-canonical (house-cleaning) NTP pyrophosphatase